MDPVKPAEPTTKAFELALFGPPVLRDGYGQTPVGLGAGKPLALLCFLAIRREVRRDEALALLWGEVDEDRARNAFRQALHRLRLALGEDLVMGDRQLLKLASEDRVRADVAEFERAIEEDRLDDALAFYAGDFLDGFDVGSRAFDEWADAERHRLRSRCRSVAELATQRALAAGHVEAAERAIRKLISVAGMDARAIEFAAASLVTLGRRAEASEVIDAFQRRSAGSGDAFPRSLRSMLERLALPGEPTPRARGRGFVGRTTELTRLLAAWQQVRPDAGATVVMEGESGIGKSRLIAEFCDAVRALGPVHLLQSHEGPRGLTAPFAAIASALRPLVRAPGVAGASPHLLAEAARLLPELRDAFQLPSVDPVHEDTARLRVCEGVAALIEAAAYERPVCLVIEDVHLASGSTLELLGYLPARLRRVRALIVMTFDPEQVSPEVADRLRRLAGDTISSDTHRVVLEPLPLADLCTLVADVLGTAGSPDTVRRIGERASGNPLRAIEMARLALDGVEPTTLPVHTRDLLRDRILACSANERRLLLAASILGRPASLRFLADASHVGAPAADDASASLRRRGLLVDVGSLVVPSSESAAAASLDLAGEATVVFVANWVAEALARDPNADAGEIARLFALAGRSGETFHWAHEAATRAFARGATEDAVYFLRIAREAAKPGPELAAVERLLTLHGAGRVQIGRSAPVGVEPGVRAFIERNFPSWRYLTGAAVATVVIAIGFTAWGSRPMSARSFLRDTLIVARADELREGRIRLAIPANDGGLVVSSAVRRSSSQPAWIDSLRLPWVNPIVSPDGRFVGLERVTPGGSNVYLVSSDRRDTIPLAVGDVEAFGMGFSPDGSRFLATRRDEGADQRVGLFAFPVARGEPPLAIDTVPHHATVEAAWAPDGTHIAWVARVLGGQEEVFVALADGSQRRNVSSHPARDLHIAWAHDGTLLAFTSWRDGNAELYAHDLLNPRLWRLTTDAAQDDRAAFDPTGRFVAFESTRGGVPGIYVMPSLGGPARRVGDSTSRFQFVAWSRPPQRYLARLHLALPAVAQPGDTVTVRVAGFDQFGDSMPAWPASWSALDPSFLRSVPATEEGSAEHRFVTLREGLARVVVSVGAWRTDTAYLRIGDEPQTLLSETFRASALSAAWRALGRPLPSIGALDGRAVVLLNGDREWESGILSALTIPLQAGLSLEATLHAPFLAAAPPATNATFALVEVDRLAAVDPQAPRLPALLSIRWDADARRLTYSAERETFVESVPSAPGSGFRALNMRLNADGTVGFLVDGVQRWRSTVRVASTRRAASTFLWLGGQDTGARVGFSAVRVALTSDRDSLP